MYYILKYRVVFVVLFMSAIGCLLPILLKIAELQIYYSVMTPLLAFVVAILETALLHERWKKQVIEKWVIPGIFLGALFIASLYLHMRYFTSGTFGYDDVNGISRNYIKGSVYKTGVEEYKKDRPDLSTDAKLLYDGFGGPDGRYDVWTPESIQHNFYAILVSYGIMVTLASSLLSLLFAAYFEKQQSSSKEVLKNLLSQNARSNYDTYLSTFFAKKTDDLYRSIKYHIFLSYSDKQRSEAENLYYALLNNGHMVFFDRNSLPKGTAYDTLIRDAISTSDLFLFFISPDAIATGHYTLSEVKFASEKWPQSTTHIFPVMVVDTPYNEIPAYLRSVTIFKASGNLTAEVIAEIELAYQKNIQAAT